LFLKTNATNPLVCGIVELCIKVPEGGMTEIEVMDITGRRVAIVLRRYLSRGTHNYIWHTDGIGPGPIFLLLKHPSGVSSQKIVILR